MSVKAILIKAAIFGGAAGVASLGMPPGLLMSPEERAAVEGSISYSGCNEVRAAGRAPIMSGEPGYRDEMDGDGDGIACEPYR